MIMVGLGLCLVLDVGDIHPSGVGSTMTRRESIHVGGLFSRSERVIHHDPWRGPLC